MSNSVWYLLAISIAFPFALNFYLRFILAPLRIRKRMPLSIAPEVTETSIDELTPETKLKLGRLIAAFSTEGFVVASNLKLGKLVAKTTGFQVLLVNRISNLVGSILVAESHNRRNLVYAVRSNFADETSIVTAFNRGVGGGLKDPRIDSISVAQIDHVSFLCELHRRRVEAAGRSKDATVVPDVGTEKQYLAAEIDRHLLNSVQRGYRTLDKTAGVARYTYKGAFLSAWKLTRPIKTWRKRLHDRKTGHLIATLGLSSWQPPVELRQIPMADISELEPVDWRPTHDVSNGVLHYRDDLPTGRVRWNWNGGRLTVHSRNRSVGETLSRQIVDVIILAVYTPLLGLFVVLRLSLWHWSGSALYYMAAIWVWIVVRLVLSVRQAGGVATVDAEPGRLRFKDAPASPRSGDLSTDDITGLIVNTVAGVSESHRLSATRHIGPPICLLISPDKPALSAVQTEIMIALGMKNRTSEREVASGPAAPAG